MSFLQNLNEAQRQAVEYIDGPSLVIAGAGSGKTMVLTYKVAYLLQNGYGPYEILALTFTNKAAREMKERVAALVGEWESSALWMGTFHSIFNRILRKEAHVFGFTPNYTIYQPSDCKSLVKSILKDMGLTESETDQKNYKPGDILNRISEAKNALVEPFAYANSKETRLRDTNNNMPRLHEIYTQYCNRCKQANVMDFDDLLLFTYKLFKEYPEVCMKYANRFRYILVDEYQDTNYAQHQIMIQLSQVHHTICVVGDDAQSIYSFRGANIENILQFRDLYPNTQLFKLERNYRSTKVIVEAANSVIAKNKRQIPKTIYSENSQGELITLKSAFSDIEEGEIVCNEISHLVRSNLSTYNQIAILYRTNAQSRIFEESLRKHAIPYRIYGGHSFYDQKVIRDVLAYFRLIINPDDEEAFKRIINVPARGLGKVTVDRLLSAAYANEVSVWTVLSSPAEYGAVFNAGITGKLNKFYNLINDFMQFDGDAYALGTKVIKESGLLAEACKDMSVEGKEMKDNLSELLNGMNAFVESQKEQGHLDSIYMTDYLSEVALLSDTDDQQDTENKDMVTLMTVHSSKGLEFDNVFIVGMEEELFPNQMASYSPKELEEERRLFYVALTRAKTRCYLTHAKSRFRFGTVDFYDPSRFLTEIDSRYLNINTGRTSRTQQSKNTNYSAPHISMFQQFGASQAKVQTTVTAPPTMKRIVHSNSPSTTAPAAVIISGQECHIGTEVEHTRFGQGIITAFSGEADNLTATIEFRNVGEKKLLLKFANLTVL